jgi:hypothetical protein
MIKLFVNNEELDIDLDSVVTFKKSQQLNGVQELYSYSNNFNLKNSSKNRRLLGINYLPNSKAKSMTAGYDVDVVLNGCIFLKKQKLKVQKETEAAIPVYLIFTDSFFTAKAKAVLMSQIDTGVVYQKSLVNFTELNAPSNTYFRTAPISAQDTSGIVSVEESVALINLKEFILRIITQLGYACIGDILTDTQLPDYYISSNVGWYGVDGTPQFEDRLTVYDFLLNFLKTFNGYVEVSDSSKTIGVFLWKNIEAVKSRFVDYSSKYVSYTEYSFEGGLANKNYLTYADSPEFYNGFFDNNKSLVERSEYLNSGFGAGSLRLFKDQELDETGLLPLRQVGEITDPQTINIFRFEDVITSVKVYYQGVGSYVSGYLAFSPNIFEIWQRFHQSYCRNIALPTLAMLKFRYDAVFLANFKMQEVFFLKQLATYWLPLELNFTTKKDEVRVKALMIEKLQADIPIVFDQSLSVDFYGQVSIIDVFALYAAYNISPAATMIVTAADLTKNQLFINNTQVLSFPTAVDVSAAFEFKVLNIEPFNVKSNSDVLFQFVSEEGGVSRIAKINIAHNGRANFLSEFRSTPGEKFTYTKNSPDAFRRYLNYSGKVTTPINIPITFAPLVGDVSGSGSTAPTAFKVLQFERNSSVQVDLSIGLMTLSCFSLLNKTSRVKATFFIWKNGERFLTVYAQGISHNRETNKRVDFANVAASRTFTAAANDSILISVSFLLETDSQVVGSIELTDIVWKFRVSEQIP